MRMMIGSLVLLVGGLASVVASPPDFSTKEELEAKKLYVSKCAKCHKFYEPKKYSDAEWQKWMQAMSRKSKLKADQDKLLKTYLDAYRSGSLEVPK